MTDTCTSCGFAVLEKGHHEDLKVHIPIHHRYTCDTCGQLIPGQFNPTVVNGQSFESFNRIAKARSHEIPT